MAPEYRELPPPVPLAGAVECLWTMRHTGETWLHRVTPDGCADILFTGSGLEVVGPMTVWRDHPIRAGERLCGVRFRPGAWRALVGAAPAELTDRMAALDCFWGARASRLAEQAAEARSPEAALEALAAAIPSPAAPGPLEQALAWMERRRGVVAMDELAARAGISPRQLRRAMLERTGLTPKFLARVLRFRYAQKRLSAGRTRGGLAELALDCGYYDQAHFIHDFREFSGRTPAADGRFFQSRERGGIVSSGR